MKKSIHWFKPLLSYLPLLFSLAEPRRMTVDAPATAVLLSCAVIEFGQVQAVVLGKAFMLSLTVIGCCLCIFSKQKDSQ
ncbi:hypothetical protein N9L54_02815 [Porticoccaceae bacterium]|nr:hypothetical protein [Porticoccaceae bacterium]